jgi:hypothetical protein
MAANIYYIQNYSEEDGENVDDVGAVRFCVLNDYLCIKKCYGHMNSMRLRLEQFRNTNDFTHDLAEKRVSGLHGYGVFAKTEIPKGKFVIIYEGEVISNRVADFRGKTYILL